MRLTDFFVGVAAKRLRPVEADPNTSNQHEFNGINTFRSIFKDERRRFETVFLYLTDEDDPIRSTGQTTWYDSRENQPNRSSEYRLYFPATDVSEKFRTDDLLIIALRPDGSLLVLATPQGSSIGDQLLWLFGLESPNGKSIVRDAPEIDRDVDFVVRWVLDAIEIEAAPPPVDEDILIKRFGHNLPDTKSFSAFAREQAPDCDPIGSPDAALMTWLETEERFFRAFERVLVADRLRHGFILPDETVDVDGFVAFSLSVQNRRKSRAGHSLENHLEMIFSHSRLVFKRGATTEGRSRPDFLFPGSDQYLDTTFPTDRLSVLGAKATCKDRWRQVLGEADRIQTKHLLTLEPSISSFQTDEMQSRSVQLVLPLGLHSTYSKEQQAWLWTVKRFVEHIEAQQA